MTSCGRHRWCPWQYTRTGVCIRSLAMFIPRDKIAVNNPRERRWRASRKNGRFRATFKTVPLSIAYRSRDVRDPFGDGEGARGEELKQAVQSPPVSWFRVYSRLHGSAG